MIARRALRVAPIPLRAIGLACGGFTACSFDAYLKFILVDAAGEDTGDAHPLPMRQVGERAALCSPSGVRQETAGSRPPDCPRLASAEARYHALSLDAAQGDLLNDSP
jgi:hypothetical protein